MKLKLIAVAISLCASAFAFAGPHGDRAKHGGFAMLDTNNDGVITRPEACGGPRGDQGVVCQKFASIDANNDGGVTKEELGVFMKAQFGERGHGKGIGALDTNGDKLISQAEACGGPRGAEGKLCANFAAIDANKDGQLSREELQAFHQANHPKRGG